MHIHVHDWRRHGESCIAVVSCRTLVIAQLERTSGPLHMAGSDALEAVLAELKKSFGYSSFKSSVQKRAVLSIVEGKSTKARAPASLGASED